MGKAKAVILTALAGIGAVGLFGPSAMGSSTPLVAAEIGFWDADLQRKAALGAFTAEELPLAMRYGQRAVRAMPYEQFGLSLASLTVSPDKQLEAMNLSSAFGWRDYVTNLRLVEAAFREDAPIIAAQRIDALGRTQGPLVAGPLADRLLALEGGSEALADRAAVRGVRSWWESWLRQPPADAASADRRMELIARFDKSDGGWLRKVVDAAVQGMGEAGLAKDSYDLWRNAVADPALFSGMLYDGAFSRIGNAQQAIGGEWVVPTKATATVEKGSGEGVVITSNGQGQGQVLSQRVSFTPGTAVLSARGEIEQGQSTDYEWQVRCDGGRRLEMTPQGDGRGALGLWRITIPADCENGYVSLNTRPGAGASLLRMRKVALEPAQ